MGCNKLLQKENNIYYVDKWAVGCDGNITAVTLRSDTVGVAEEAFAYRSTLMSIYIPASLHYIGRRAFFNSQTNLEIIEVESENAYYYSEGCCSDACLLYDKATHKIIAKQKNCMYAHRNTEWHEDHVWY